MYRALLGGHVEATNPLNQLEAPVTDFFSPYIQYIAISGTARSGTSPGENFNFSTKKYSYTPPLRDQGEKLKLYLLAQFRAQDSSLSPGPSARLIS